ncbi:MAG: hypothetical protein HC871_13020 [Rhizobiales bacterium]|nr:hypothetical protein [Hyphomicrobiales bacterium]
MAAPDPAMHPSKKWSAYASSLAVLSLLALAVMHVLGFATQALNLVAMGCIVASGTVAWLVQAKLPCPDCGRLYGYRFRFVNARICRHCGGEFPL